MKELSAYHVIGTCSYCGAKVALNEVIVQDDTYYSGCCEKPVVGFAKQGE